MGVLVASAANEPSLAHPAWLRAGDGGGLREKDAFRGITLEQVLATLDAPIEVATSVWICRELARNLSEALLEFDEGTSLPLSAIVLSKEGDLRLAAWGVERNGAPSDALSQLLVVLMSLMRGRDLRPESKTLAQHVSTIGEASVSALCKRIAEGAMTSLSEAEENLARIFYRELSASDGPQRIRSLITKVSPKTGELDSSLQPWEARLPPGAETEFDASLKGSFTEALDERADPVVPQPLGNEDHPSMPLSRPQVRERPKSGSELSSRDRPETARPLSPQLRGATTKEGGMRSPSRVGFAMLWYAAGFLTALFIVALVSVFSDDDSSGTIATSAPDPAPKVRAVAKPAADRPAD